MALIKSPRDAPFRTVLINHSTNEKWAVSQHSAGKAAAQLHLLKQLPVVSVSVWFSPHLSLFSVFLPISHLYQGPPSHFI